MNWIKNEEGDTLINLDNVTTITICDKGSDYTTPFEVVVEFSNNGVIVLKEFKTSAMAQVFLSRMAKKVGLTSSIRKE